MESPVAGTVVAAGGRGRRSGVDRRGAGGDRDRGGGRGRGGRARRRCRLRSRSRRSRRRTRGWRRLPSSKSLSPRGTREGAHRAAMAKGEGRSAAMRSDPHAPSPFRRLRRLTSLVPQGGSGKSARPRLPRCPHPGEGARGRPRAGEGGRGRSHPPFGPRRLPPLRFGPGLSAAPRQPRARGRARSSVIGMRRRIAENMAGGEAQHPALHLCRRDRRDRAGGDARGSQRPTVAVAPS